MILLMCVFRLPQNLKSAVSSVQMELLSVPRETPVVNCHLDNMVVVPSLRLEENECFYNHVIPHIFNPIL